MTIEQSELAIALLQSMLIHVDEATDIYALSSTLLLGRQEGLAAYDAALEAIGCPLSPQDLKIFAEIFDRNGFNWAGDSI